MTKCRVVDKYCVLNDIFILLQFQKPCKIKPGYKLIGSNSFEWKIIKLVKYKPETIDEETMEKSLNQWDCLLQPLNNSQLPLVGEELLLIKSE